jgi:hypothetical protein
LSIIAGRPAGFNYYSCASVCFAFSRDVDISHLSCLNQW